MLKYDLRGAYVPGGIPQLGFYLKKNTEFWEALDRRRALKCERKVNRREDGERKKVCGSWWARQEA